VVSVPEGDTLNQVTPLKEPCEVTVYVVLVVAVTPRVVDTATPLACGESVSAEEPRVNDPDPDETLLPTTERTIGILSGLSATWPVTVTTPVYRPLARLLAFTLTVATAETGTLTVPEVRVSHGVLPGLLTAAVTKTGDPSLDAIVSA
jgi:hypothetical protein